MSVYAVIMAGGQGERLWPLSTPERPKQFLRLFGTRTMLQHTADRIQPLVPSDHILVVTGCEYAGLVHDQLPDLPEENIIPEPFGRGTAACVALSAAIIKKQDPEALIMVLTADHRIEDVERFRQLLHGGLEVASNKSNLVTLGIPPNRPETGYGYILAPRPVCTLDEGMVVHAVDEFTEKPNLETAKRYLAAETYFWNSGMFIWHVDAILGAIKEYIPMLSDAVARISGYVGSSGFLNELREVYESLESQSIDRGVMERSSRAVLLPAGDIGWSDIGSWDALREALETVDKPWGHEQLWALNQHYAGKFLHIRAGESLSMQYHEVKDETICTIEGKLCLRIGLDLDCLEERFLPPGAHVHIAPGMIHQMEAIEDCIIAEVSTSHLADVVRIKDRYGRVQDKDERISERGTKL